MYFSFKSQPEDFLVKEVLEYPLDWIWDFFYIFFEKRLINTMDVINTICHEYHLKRNNLWICWLKDKDWITQQRISIHKKYLLQCWWENKFLSFMRWIKWITDIIDTWRHNSPLSVWKNKWNIFTITLKKRENLPESLKDSINTNLINFQKNWIPNIFWYQRFWKWNKNFKKVLKILSWEEKISDNYEQKFKFQTFGSLRFNEYVMRRRENSDLLIDWDIMVNWRNAFWTNISVYSKNKLHHFDYREEKKIHEWSTFREPSEFQRTSDYIKWKWIPTWIVLWTEQLVCKAWTAWRIYDDSIIKESKFLEWGENLLRKIGIFWYRRPLWIIPQELERDWNNWDLILKFFLPTWCYASSFLTFLLKDIDPKWCESNNLKILRINQL